MTALITLDPAEVDGAGRDPQELVQEIVDDVNRDRVRVEQIKRFAILPRDFSQEEGELTPTLKLRRKVVHEHFADEIEHALRVTAGFLVASAFLASAVEFVEALTIVLAAGITRGWRSALAGPRRRDRRARGDRRRARPGADARSRSTSSGSSSAALLLAFGLQWLRKAILRASGYKALHDEDAIFARERRKRAQPAHEERAGLDWYGFTLAFKGVLLEGLEVAFIVITFGSTQGSIGLAALGAGHRARARRGRRRARPRAADARAREHDEVRRRRDADDVRDLLGGRRRRRALARRRRVAARSCSRSSSLLSFARRRDAQAPAGRRSHEAHPRVRPLLVGLRRRRRLARRRGRRVAIGATAALVAGGVDAWWLMPVAVACSPLRSRCGARCG